MILVIGALLFVGPLAPAPRDVRLTEERFEGKTTIETRDSIFIDQTQLGSEADVTLRTGTVVTFGEGFTVEPGASLALIIDSEQDTSPVVEDREPAATNEAAAVLLAPRGKGA